MDLTAEQVSEIIVSYVGQNKWNEMSEIERMRCSNIYSTYKECIDTGISVPVPEFMLPPKNVEAVNRQKSEKTARKQPNSCSPLERPKRNLKKVHYEESETFMDGFIYCDNCEIEYENFCPRCGMLTHVRDNKIKMGVKNRSRKTVPAGVLEIKPSTIHGEGVFSMKTLPKGLKFGPYEGIQSVNSSTGYAWRLRGGKLIDAEDQTKSNWMRYINCARNVNEQNMMAFQYLGKMYYRTVRRIESGEELLVYYGDNFAEILGIDTNNYFEPEIGEVDDENEFVCDPCGFVFSEEKYLVGHNRFCRHVRKKIMDLNRNIDTFTCRYCKVEITDEKLFGRHVKFCKWKTLRTVESTTADEENKIRKKYKCDNCQYQTDFKCHLIMHTRIHTGEVPFICSKCGKRFNQKHHLETHKRIHTGEKNFKCNYCDKSFNQSSNLQRHIRLHSSVRAFKCSDCDMSFNVKGSLKYHRMTKHECGKKAHECDQCKYSTARLSDLNKHKMIHDNKKPFKCTQCDYECRQSGNLKQHIRRHTGEKPYKCKLCEYASVTSTNLQKHIKSKH